jgi:ABC-type bacteriocin/lantibiotic exporter with double-glycine peptidase domain
MPGISLIVAHYKQEYPYSCVAACVRMVLAHFGRTCSEGELRQLMGTGPHGTYARDILRIAALGFDVQLAPATLADLGTALTAGTPPIVFLDTGSLDYWSSHCFHVAVVVGLDLTSVSLNDPLFDTAPQQTSLSGFQQAWDWNQRLAAIIRPRP